MSFRSLFNKRKTNGRDLKKTRGIVEFNFVAPKKRTRLRKSETSCGKAFGTVAPKDHIFLIIL